MTPISLPLTGCHTGVPGARELGERLDVVLVAEHLRPGGGPSSAVPMPLVPTNFSE